MSKASRVIIVLVLASAAAAVLLLKHRSPEQGVPAAAVEVRPDGTATDTPVAVQNEDPLPRLVDLGAGKCIPCKMMAPILDELKADFAGTFDVEFIDVWEDVEAGEAYGIRMIPTQIFYDPAGKELFRHEGFFSREEILATWNEYGVAVASAPAEQ